MDNAWQFTIIVNDTGKEFGVQYDGHDYTLRSKSFVSIGWNIFDPRDTLLTRLTFMTGGVELRPIFLAHDLYENVQITISCDVDDTYSCRMTRRLDHVELRSQAIMSMDFFDPSITREIEDLQKKVTISHMQCEHLYKKCLKGVERLQQTFPVGHPKAGQEFWIRSGPLLEFILSKFFCSLLEGEALLRSCTGDFYNKAAFTLSSPPPCVPTLSKFALAIRELDWTVDFLCCVLEPGSKFGNWEWCEEKCRPVYLNRLVASEEESLQADVRRQSADREALQKSVSLKPSTSSSKFWNFYQLWASTNNQDKLEAIWRKRLQPSSCASESYSPLDAFVIDKSDTSFVQIPSENSKHGTSKNVQKCKWLGETVALSTMWGADKFAAKAETGLLARVQHPNVVELMGYAHEEDARYPSSYKAFYLVTEHMESDLHDLITEQLKEPDESISKSRPPFDFPVAVDIALQIVEAMIHVHKCRVVHRDLKPKNILASRKYSLPGSSLLPVYYSIKLIDFGSSKRGDQDSHFGTRKQGTANYMAPEVWESEERYSWSADVYSFGLTCYEIFTGRLPFENGMSFANIQSAMRGTIEFPFPHPEELKVLIEKCWARNPSDRPSFEDIRNALWLLKLCAWQY